MNSASLKFVRNKLSKVLVVGAEMSLKCPNKIDRVVRKHSQACPVVTSLSLLIATIPKTEGPAKIFVRFHYDFRVKISRIVAINAVIELMRNEIQGKNKGQAWFIDL